MPYHSCSRGLAWNGRAKKTACWRFGGYISSESSHPSGTGHCYSSNSNLFRLPPPRLSMLPSPPIVDFPRQSPASHPRSPDTFATFPNARFWRPPTRRSCENRRKARSLSVALLAVININLLVFRFSIPRFRRQLSLTEKSAVHQLNDEIGLLRIGHGDLCDPFRMPL